MAYLTANRSEGELNFKFIVCSGVTRFSESFFVPLPPRNDSKLQYLLHCHRNRALFLPWHENAHVKTSATNWEKWEILQRFLKKQVLRYRIHTLCSTFFEGSWRWEAEWGGLWTPKGFMIPVFPVDCNCKWACGSEKTSIQCVLLWSSSLFWVLRINDKSLVPDWPLLCKLHEISSGYSQENHSNCCYQISHFDVKMHQFDFGHRTHWGSLQRYPILLST